MDKPVVGQLNPVQYKGWFTTRNLGIAAVFVVALVGGGVHWHNHAVTTQHTKQVNAAIAQSTDAYNRGDDVNAINLLGGMAALATSGKQKAQVYQGQAQAALGANKLADALHYYDLKHQADPSTAKPDAYAIGTIYERLGKKDQALAEYKIALAYAKIQHGQTGNDAAAIQASIDELEQQ